VFGEMLDCMQNRNQSYTLEDVVLRVVGDLHVPIAYGLRSGHVSRGNVTLPFGVRAALSVKSGSVSLRVTESAAIKRSMHAGKDS
jgi:muramoyltetrapeptide carboxypeptidase